MMRHTRFVVRCLAMLASASALQAAGKPGPEPDCGRACLRAAIDRYIAALVAHDPARVPLARDVQFVENVTRLKPGEGFWKTASAPPTTFRIYVPDPVSQQVGFLGVMQEEGKPVEVAIRLKLKEGQIVEAEQLIARGLRDTSLPNLQVPRTVFTTAVPEAERGNRQQLLAIASTYYEALTRGNGKLSPFADDCVRRENGMQTTGNPPPQTPGMGTLGAMGCAAQLDTKSMSYIDSIDDRRVDIADPVTGLAFGLSHFRHSMKQGYVNIVGVPGVTRVDMPFKPFDLPAAHIYKISGGKLHEIEAMGFMAPYQSKTGWE